jgi:Flp pilus assembly protein TadD
MPDAIHQYQMAVGIKDDSAMETNLANGYAAINDLDDAVKAYRRAIELNPANPNPHCNLGITLMRQGKLDEAVKEFMTTIRVDPYGPNGRQGLYKALKAMGINPEEPDQPEVRGKYDFDLDEALRMLRSQPPAGQ